MINRHMLAGYPAPISGLLVAHRHFWAERLGRKAEARNPNTTVLEPFLDTYLGVSEN